MDVDFIAPCRFDDVNYVDKTIAQRLLHSLVVRKLVRNVDGACCRFLTELEKSSLLLIKTKWGLVNQQTSNHSFLFACL